MSELRVKRLRPSASLPSYQTPGSAGMDLCAALDEPVVLQPGDRRIIPTGIAVAAPENVVLDVRPRSGLAARYGVTVLNMPGTVDSDYRGEVGVILVNLGSEPFVVEPGMRIAQLVALPVFHLTPVEVEELDETDRGSGGFGSTGMYAVYVDRPGNESDEAAPPPHGGQHA